jgi:hypothetical protein
MDRDALRAIKNRWMVMGILSSPAHRLSGIGRSFFYVWVGGGTMEVVAALLVQIGFHGTACVGRATDRKMPPPH